VADCQVVFRFGELFSGAGGLSCGALGAAANLAAVHHQLVHAWAADYDPWACATYRRNICPSTPETVICDDVRRMDGEGRLSPEALGPADALAFGFPCNDFSVVGERRGIHGEFGPLYTYCVKALNRFRPRFFIAENVGGIRSANDGRAFARILSELRQAGDGYRLTAHLYRAEQYGVPQARARVIIVGIARDAGRVFHVPAPTTADCPPTAREALEIPPLPDDAPNHERAAQSVRVIERLRHIRPGENAWTADLPPDLRLNVKGARLSQIYRRLDPDRPAYTVTGSGGGGTHVYHWAQPRALTNRERARLQTFPDDFVFLGPREAVRRQIGMAVPPRLAAAVVSAILRTFADIPYPSVPANIDAGPPGPQLPLSDLLPS